MKHIVSLFIGLLIVIGMSAQDVTAKPKKPPRTFYQMGMIKTPVGFMTYGKITFNKSSEIPKIVKAINKELKESFKELMLTYNEEKTAYKTWLEEQEAAEEKAYTTWKEENPEDSKSTYKKKVKEDLIEKEYDAWASEQGENLPKKEKSAHKKFLKWIKKNPDRHYASKKPRAPMYAGIKLEGSKVREPTGEESTKKYEKFEKTLTKKKAFAEKYNEKLSEYLGIEAVNTGMGILFATAAPE